MSHGDDVNGNELDLGSLVLLHQSPVCCSSAAAVVDVCVVVAAAVDAVIGVVADAAAFLKTFPTDCPNLLRSLFLIPQRLLLHYEFE